MRSQRISLFSILLLIASSIIGQTTLVPDRFTFDDDLEYHEGIPSPSDFQGYEHGERFTLYANSVAYFKELSRLSDRVLINSYGETYEKRGLYNLIISSPDNLRNLEEIRKQNLSLSDPHNLSPAEAEQIIHEKPVFVSFSYNIHGNEASSTEAAMQVAYRLGAAMDDETAKLLDQAIIILYICVNPDGRDRFAYWFNSIQREVPGIEPGELEHYEPWPGGRTNHYWFDLNRDWIWVVHPEMKGLTGEYQRWLPQLHVDYHEQGYNNNYFTMPGTTPRNKFLPDQYEALTDTIGRANIAVFDRNRINYFTREAFDFFYPGYGSSYPSTMNAIGMLTEQGGGSSRAIETDDGYILTLRQRIYDHYMTSLATIRKSVEQKSTFNRYTFHSADHTKSKSDTKAYLLEDDRSEYVPDVINILLHHGIEVNKITEDITVSKAESYRTGKVMDKTFKHGTYLVSTEQPRHIFIHSVLDNDMTIEDSVMYDMSTWSAPLAFNLEAWKATSMPNAKVEQVVEKLTPESGVSNSEAQYAFVIDWRQRGAPKALSMLWQKGYRVRSAQESFRIDNRSFSPGTLIILQGRNLEKTAGIRDDMEAISQKAGVQVYGLNSGRVQEGIDLASRKSRSLEMPRTALLVDRPFSAYSCGQIYYLFDQETSFPITRIRPQMLIESAYPAMSSQYGMSSLQDFDVLIVAGGGSSLSEVFDNEGMKKIKMWVESGGTLIASESAATFFNDSSQGGFVDVEQIQSIKDSSDEASYLPFHLREDFFGKKRIPGAGLRAHIDTSHPLAFGTKKSAYSIKFDTEAFDASPDLHTVGYYYEDAEELLASGYASEENLALLAGHVFAGVKPLGVGHVVLLRDNTQYRMFWRGLSRMMQNAVMLLPSY
jgi:hypothetical protein